MKENIRHSIGEKVVALSDSIEPPSGYISQKRKKGMIYKVNSIEYCPKCGTQAINHDNIFYENLNIIYCDCDFEYRATSKLIHSHSHLFGKLDEKTLEEMIEAEEYEIAAAIRDELKVKQPIN